MYLNYTYLYMHSHHWRQKGTLSGNKNQFQISSEVFEFCASFWPENFFVLVREQRIEPRSSPTFIETMSAAKCARHHSIPNNWLWISVNEDCSGQALYYGHWTTSQNFKLPYIFCKVDLYIAITLYITVTFPFPRSDHCTQVWL